VTATSPLRTGLVIALLLVVAAISGRSWLEWALEPEDAPAARARPPRPPPLQDGDPQEVAQTWCNAVLDRHRQDARRLEAMRSSGDGAALRDGSSSLRAAGPTLRRAYRLWLKEREVQRAADQLASRAIQTDHEASWPAADIRDGLRCAAVGAEPDGDSTRVTVAMEAGGSTWACRYYWLHLMEPEHYRLVDASAIRWLAPGPDGPMQVRFPTAAHSLELRPAPTACP